MTIILSIFQIILMLLIILFEFKKKSVSVFLWAILLVIFGIMHLITCFIGNSQYPAEVLNEASIYVILFMLTYIITRLLLINDNNSNVLDFKNDNEMYDNKIYYKILIIFLIVVVIYQVYNLIVNAGGIFNTSWGNMRKYSLSQKYFSFSQTFTTLFFSSSSCLLIALKRKNKKEIIIISILILLEVIISRNRIEILPLFCAFLAFYISKLKTITPKIISTLSIILIVVIYSVYGLRVFRHYGTLSTFINEFKLSDFNEKIKYQIKTDDGELGLKNHFYYFINNDNNFKNFGKGNTYKRMLLVWLPTGWSYGLKPDDFAISMGYAVNPTIVGYSVHPTLFGDCYANFGFIGFIGMGIFWSIYVTAIDFMIKRKKDKYFKYSLVSICSISYIIIGRGSVYNGFVWLFFGMIILHILNFLTKFKIKN